MPAGAAGGGVAGAGPLDIAVLGLVGFPEGEVGTVFLLVGVLALGFAGEGGADLELAFLHAGERAVSIEGRHLEIHRTVGGAVGVSFFHEDLDHGDLLGNVGGGGGLDVGAQAVEGVAVGVKFVGPLFGDLGERAALLAGAADGLVVHVGEVADVLHLVLAELEFEQATEEVVDHEGAEVADVRGRVNGGAAVVEAIHAVGVGRAELARGSGEGIVEGDGHRRTDGGDGRNADTKIELTLNPTGRMAAGAGFGCGLHGDARARSSPGGDLPGASGAEWCSERTHGVL